MNRLILSALVAWCSIFSLVNRAYACPPPDVWISDSLLCVPVDDPYVEIRADEYSGTEITGWTWDYYPAEGFTVEDEYDGTGLYPYSTRGVRFETAGQWYVYATAANSDDLTDSDWAHVYVIDLTIDDEPGRDTDEYLAYQSPTAADIYYTILPDSFSTRYWANLSIKDHLDNTIRTEDLTGLLGVQHTTWDGKKDDGTWAPPGQYTVMVELQVGYYYSGRFSDSHPIAVYNLEITSPTGIDRDVAFDANQPGVCSVTVTGTAGASSLDADLEWELQDISDANLTSIPSPPSGSTVTFTYTGLPADNNDFGPKDVTLRLKDSQGTTVAQTVGTIRLFFDPNSNNHGVLSGEATDYNDTPNWFYYWRKGMVVPDLADSQFIYDPTQDYGLYDPNCLPGQGQLRVGPKAGGSDTVDKVFHNYFVNTRLLTGRNGINDTPRFSDPNPPYPIDDVNCIDYGKGEPSAVAIVPGADGILQTQPVPDDERVEINGVWVITTGPDGRLNTLKHQDDDYQTYLYDGAMVPIYPLPDANGLGGGGKPGTISVTPGPDGWLDLELYIRVDDGIDLSTLDVNDPNLNHDYIGSWHGIDICAITCIHELVHKKNYDDGGGGSSDHDQDGVITPNEGSRNYYLNYCLKDTYNLATTLHPDYAAYGDNEFLCRIEEMRYVDPNTLRTEGRTDPDKDWSKEGKRWQKY